MAAAFFLSALLAGIALVSLRYQVRNWRRLRSEPLASDDRRYLRGVARRRTVNAVLLLVLAGMLTGAYLSGQQELNRILHLKQQEPPAEPTAEDKEFVRAWAIYWMAVLGLLFLVIAIAIADYTATSLYGRQELRRIRQEQRTLLERDLAVYRQAKLNDRAKRLE
jgi:hypothetical protein